MPESDQLSVPPALKPGDAVSVVAPASSPDRAVCEAALAGLESYGYRPKTYRDLCTPVGYLSGADEQRSGELQQAIDDPETAMILAVRGGNGVGRILDQVDLSPLIERPKIVCGYSDITALHMAIQQRCRLVSFHGPNLVSGLGDTTEATSSEREAFHRLVSGELKPGDSLCPDTARLRTVRGGVAEGHLIGGNFATVNSILRTPAEPSFDGAVLFVEDIGEHPYRIDRLLVQLRLGGLLQQLAGVVVGYFTDCVDEGPTVEEVLFEFFEPLGVPVLAGFPAGHEHPNLPLPLGARVRLDADQRDLLLAQRVVG